MMIQDEKERLKALDPSQSFIVQAPAGSGKTELLIQRILVLLSIVKQPEEILAITFTKKSAAEMQERILNALQNAKNNPEPQTSHERKTWHLAKKVLERDEALQWNLLINPNRLRLQTIDSFNSSLTRQLPILSQFGATPEIMDKPYLLYKQAIQELLSHLEENHDWSNAIATILTHMDNDLNKVEFLLIYLLSKRDQWLRHITANADNAFLREQLEKNLSSVVSDVLLKLKNIFPSNHKEELCFLLKLPQFPGNDIQDKKHWLAIADFFLTKKNEWRKRINLSTQFEESESLRNAFEELRYSPDVTYQENQWETLQALHYVLRIAAAQLKIVFQQHGKIDYIQNALAAEAALGSDELPTDLTLALDYQIKHILIDEFQDTSNSQYHLLKKITAGWEPGDGRTLFLVGDPMQSIYRFREAEVGIFIRTCQYGIGNIKLVPLTLSVNFRSTPGIVNWINTHFPYVFPTFDDIAAGAVSYSPSVAHQQISAENTISLNAFSGTHDAEQANAIVSLIQNRQKEDPEGTIAILVRSRTHLENIIPALKNAQLSYQAIKIDPLTERPFIQDLMALTRALLHPADRIAWLSVLRAPWCGLSLSDLLILGTDKNETLWEQLQSSEKIAHLSPDGQTRLNRILPTLKIKTAERKRTNLRAWIESTWLLIGGPAYLEHETDLEDAETYFKLLNNLNDSFDLDLLNYHANQLNAAPNNDSHSKLQIMTMHNAKGLEFDTVILPHLEKKPRNNDKQILLWMERPRTHSDSDLILAPVHATGHDVDSIYEYIKQENALKNDYEASRLLYVAMTRAKKRLDLFFTVKDEDKVNSNSLLGKFWHCIRNETRIISNELDIFQKIDDDSISQTMRRISLDWKNPVKENKMTEISQYHNEKVGFQLYDNTAKHIGTLTHQILQQMSLYGIDWWKLQSSTNKNAYLKNQLLQLGVFQNLKETVEKIIQAIENVMRDPRGIWILSTHKEAKAEFNLTAVIDNEAKQFIIDRTFVDENNVRWIIDYKTATIAEKNKYQKQMWHYFQAIREIDDRPIRMGLYFPFIPAWHEWEFTETGEVYENLAN